METQVPGKLVVRIRSP